MSPMYGVTYYTGGAEFVAIIETGGKQIKVEEGQEILILKN